MTIKANRILLERQASIEVECIHWKTMQTDYSYDLDFYRFCDWKINSLNEEAEQIRPGQNQPVRGALHLCSDRIGLQQIIQHQMMHRKEYGHGEDGHREQKIIDPLVGSAACSQQDGEAEGQHRGRQEIDPDQNLQSAAKQA